MSFTTLNASSDENFMKVATFQFQSLKLHPTDASFHFDGLVQERLNSIANTLELHLSCTKPSISYQLAYTAYGSGHGTAAALLPGFAINW